MWKEACQNYEDKLYLRTVLKYIVIKYDRPCSDNHRDKGVHTNRKCDFDKIDLRKSAKQLEILQKVFERERHKKY